MPTTIGTPAINTYAAVPYLGMRVQTPMKGMFGVVDRLSKTLHSWFKSTGITPAGAPFLRFHVIDMAGIMDVEYAIPIAEQHAGTDTIRPDALPAGRYASLIYQGSGLAGNKALLNWMAAEGLRSDRWDVPEGDQFAARFERFLTDPAVEPRKTRWDIEVAIKLVD